MRSLLGSVRNNTPVPYVGRQARVSGGAGLTVTTATKQLESSGSVSTLFSVVNRLSNATSQVDWHLYRKTQDGRRRYGPSEDNRREVTSHAALDCLNTPTPFSTRQELVEAGQQHNELTGETFLVLGRTGPWPTSMWLVRPDRMEVVTDPVKFIIGYIYTAPDGAKTLLDPADVMMIRQPNPMSAFRGMSAVLPLLTDLDSVRFATLWNRNFFVNSAEPGGVITVPDNWDDATYDKFTARWDELHRGVGNAHRPAVLENGATFDGTTISQKDMQFVELRTQTRDTILEAFGVPKSILGITEDVNRASAEAGEVTFGRWALIPRLERWKQMLNNDFLPQFGPAGANLEFDYDTPIPPDQLTENATLSNQVTNYLALVAGRVDPDEAAQLVGLPPLTMIKPAPAILPPTPPSPDANAPEADGTDGTGAGEDQLA